MQAILKKYIEIKNRKHLKTSHMCRPLGKTGIL